MANELQLCAESGLTVIARVFNDSGAQVSSDVSCPEIGSNGLYSGSMPSAAAGSYGVRFYSSGTLIVASEIFWDGSKEISLFNLKQANTDLKFILSNVA